MARNRFFGLTNRVLLIIAALLLVLSYLSMFVNPAVFWLMSVAGLMFVPFCVLNLFLLVWAFVRRSRAFVIPLLALIPAVFLLGRYVRYAPEDDSDAITLQSDVRVMSWNVGRFAMSNKALEFADYQACADSVFKYIREQEPDIVCLQEVQIKDSKKIKQYLNREMPGYSHEYYMFPTRRGSFGNVTLSKYPVKNRGVIRFDASANLAIFTDYKVDGKTFRVYNCHFESYNISFSGIVRALLRSDKEVFAQTGEKMRKSITRRPKQVNMVFDDIEQCPVEAFVCGDFNDNPASYTYSRMMKNRRDTFVEAGEGFGATYSLLWPLLRIDYILCPESCEVVSHTTPHVRLSDHYPVISEIAL